MFFQSIQPNSAWWFLKVMLPFLHASTNVYPSRFRSGYSSVASKRHLLIFSLTLLNCIYNSYSLGLPKSPVRTNVSSNWRGRRLAFLRFEHHPIRFCLGWLGRWSNKLSTCKFFRFLQLIRCLIICLILTLYLSATDL